MSGTQYAYKVVRSLDELSMIFSIRSIVFIESQNCPYFEEFDQNDLSGALHLLALAGPEPVGCLRMRWFGGFVKIERIAMRSGWRTGSAGHELVNEALRIASRKGFDTAIIHAQKGLVDYWSEIGFEICIGRDVFKFSGYEYIEMAKKIPRSPNALTLTTDPAVINRPEGEWDKAGPLEGVYK